MNGHSRLSRNAEDKQPVSVAPECLGDKNFMNTPPQKAWLNMARKIVDQQKISFLIGAGFFLIFVAVIGFGLAVVYNVVRLQASTQEIYIHYFSVSNAGPDTQTALSQLHNHTIEIIHLVWWFLGGMAIFNIFSGVVVIRKVVAILEHDQQTSKKLYESEERLKLALSGADEGTWDLDILTGRLNFDSQWGEMLGYTSEKERPYYLDEWSALIHSEDRDRVLKAMHDHVAGWTSEYKAEYRIRSRSGGWKWFAGHGRAVHRDPEGKALRIVGVTRDITLKKQTEERIWRLAHSDSLTGLPNRPLFYERLSQSVAMARRHDKKLALLFLDLDGFKQVNDKFGHDTGDELLQEVAERLRQHIRGEDIVARTGGDEFIFILNDISHAGNAAIVANKIIRSLTEPFVMHGNTCLIGGSIGISIFPDDSDEMETLVTQSDNAMYKAKENGKNNYQFFAAPK